MRSVLGILASIFLASWPLSIQAQNLEGTYKNGGITIKIEKVDSVWKVNCKEQGMEGSGSDHLDVEPFDGEFQRWEFKYKCKPIERLEGDNYYKVTITSKKKYDCMAFGESVGKYSPDLGSLDTDNRYSDSLWIGLKDASTLGVDMPNSTRRGGDCSVLNAYYKRIK